MNFVNRLFTSLGDWLLMPFESWPLAGLLFWSAVAGVAMTYAFGKTSNQRALQRVADRARAQLFAIKLFKDDLGVTMRAQAELLKLTGLRLLHSLPPMLVMIVPFVFILSQLGLRYEHRALQPGETTVVALDLSPDAWAKYRDVQLDAPDGVVQETEPLRDEAATAVYWRIRPETSESAPLRWQLGDETIEKQLAISTDTVHLQNVNPKRPGPSLLDRILYPGESAFSKTDQVQSITIQHPLRATPVLGLDLPWWATFLIVSMVVALLVRRVLGVQF